jgi:uncharacterized protein (TIGR00251 family)
MGNLKIEEIDGGIVLPVKVVPGSSKTSIAGLLDGMLKVKVSAPPEKGKANQCLIDFLAKKLSVKKNNIKIISGSTNPAKRIEISGISANAVSKKIKIN